jgi:GTP1/Obg family GTP-binding protein
MTMNTDDRKEILKSLKDISASMTTIEAARDAIKEFKKDVCETYQLDRKVFGRVAKAFHKGNKDEETALFNDFEELYDQVAK